MFRWDKAIFSPTGLVLYNGVELEADIVVFDTGYHRMKTTARQTLADAVASGRMGSG